MLQYSIKPKDEETFSRVAIYRKFIATFLGRPCGICNDPPKRQQLRSVSCDRNYATRETNGPARASPTTSRSTLDPDDDAAIDARFEE